MTGLIEKVLAGDLVAAAKLITMVENNRDDAAKTIKEIFQYTGNAYIIGITGSPGVGKSTLVSEMVRIFRERNQTVGVIAVDASSPFTGGAVLGDRIRMHRHKPDDAGVFVRSMATRGHLGGVSVATRDASFVMDALGRDVIIIETVGVGQVELEIAKMAYTTVVALAPGMGDSIQAIKAGIMEIGDIFVVNKADHDGADATVMDIHNMLTFRTIKSEWEPQIYKTSAVSGKGVAEFIDGIEKHKRYLKNSDLINKKKYDKEQLLYLVKERVERWILADKFGKEYFDKYVKRIIEREVDPYTASENILKEMGLHQV